MQSLSRESLREELHASEQQRLQQARNPEKPELPLTFIPSEDGEFRQESGHYGGVEVELTPNVIMRLSKMTCASS